MTRQALLNAIVVDLAIGGSTNAVLHLLTFARELGIELALDDFDRQSRKVPCICSVTYIQHLKYQVFVIFFLSYFQDRNIVEQLLSCSGLNKGIRVNL